MKFYTTLFGSIMILNLAGCTSSQEMKDEDKPSTQKRKPQR